MKSYVIDAYTDLDGLSSKYTDNAPEPKPGQNDVLCDVYSAALNFFGALGRSKAPHYCVRDS